MNIIFYGIAPAAVITAVLSVFFIYFLIVSARRINLRKKEAVSKVMVLAPLSALFYLLSGVVYYRQTTNFMIYEIVLSVMPLIVAMRSDIGWTRSLGYAAMMFALSIVTMIVRFLLPQGTSFVDNVFSFAPLFMVMSLVFVLIQDFQMLLSDRKRIIKTSTVRYRLYSGIDLIYLTAVFLVVMTALMLDDAGPVMERILFVLSLTAVMMLFAFISIRVSEGRMLIFQKKKDDEMKELMTACMSDSREFLRGDHAYRSIYERLVAYFERDSPFLNPELSVDDVAKELYCNRLYLSKAIGMFTGRNFCQFVNYYRIRHAVKIFEEDKGLKLGVWSEMSGYRTVANFNIAFRLFMNDTPGEWCRKVRGELPKYKRDK